MYLVFDIGGTNIRIATSLDGETLDQQETIPTSMDFQESMKNITEVVKKLSGNQSIKLACGGVRALHKSKKYLVHNPNFPMWVEEPLHKKLEEILDTAVFLENDAALAGLGEAVFGPGKNHKIVAFHTISTGIGGVRVVDGQIDQNSIGFEPGNQIIDMDGSVLGQKEPVVWEAYASGDALRKRFHKKAEEITDDQVWEETAQATAISLNNTLVYWSPDIIVLGGSMMKSIPIERVNYYLHQTVKIFPELPPVVKAELGDLVGLYGALALLKTKLK